MEAIGKYNVLKLKSIRASGIVKNYSKIFSFEDDVTNRFITVKAFKSVEGIVSVHSGPNTYKGGENERHKIITKSNLDNKNV